MTQPASREPRSDNSICKCGLARSYHGPNPPNLADHEYEPRYPATQPASRKPRTDQTTPVSAEPLPFPTTDARKWAAEFVRLHGGDEGLMLAWFANAIEHGRGPDAGRRAVRA